MARPPHVPQPQTELEEFFDLSIDPLSIVGFDGEFKRVNKSFLRLLGYTKAQLFTRTALEILHPDDVGAAREGLAQIAEGRDAVAFEARVVCADGSVRWLEWNTRSMPERGVVYSVGRDTTERRGVDAELRALAEEQAALRRVATLVAQDAASTELFGAVAREVGVLLAADLAGMIRYEDAGTVTAVAAWAAIGEHPPVPEHWHIEPGDPAWLVLESGAATRVEDWANVPGPFAEAVRNSFGVSSSVGCPIVAEGRMWGALAVHSKQNKPLPPDTESRMAQFTDLVGTAIASAASRGRADRLGEEQAALRRVATLVAKEASPAEVFVRVAEEAATLLGEVECALLRDEGDGSASAVAAWGAGMSARFPVGTRVPGEGDGVLASVLRAGRPRRIDDYSDVGASIAEGAHDHGIGSAVGHPIVVGGGVWGAIITARFGAGPCPPETESHLARFADLVATAVANADARAEVERLAAEQAALRRVATLVAGGTPSEAFFSAVCGQVEALVEADASAVVRFETDGTVTVMGTHGVGHPVDPRPGLDPDYIVADVHRTGRAARFDTDDTADPSMPEIVRAERIRSGVASPIVVDGELWGAFTIGSRHRPLPAGVERRLSDFTELVATAIANADSRDQLISSRARLLTAGDEARRRVVRDLHDGAQQRLVHTIVTLKLAQRAFRDEDGEGESLLGEALDNAEQSNRELRELAHGILPAPLTRGGLEAGVAAVVARLDLPVRVDVPAERLPAEIEASAYFIVAEALTNVVKHSQAARAEVTASLDGGMLRIEVRDNGAGDADPDGHGLVGMRDRVTTLGGRLEIESPAGGGTLVAATLPLTAG